MGLSILSAGVGKPFLVCLSTDYDLICRNAWNGCFHAQCWAGQAILIASCSWRWLLLYILLKKIFLAKNIRNKCVIRNISLFFFIFLFCFVFCFLTSLKMPEFFSEVLNMITDSFLIEKWGTLEVARIKKL